MTVSDSPGPLNGLPSPPSPPPGAWPSDTPEVVAAFATPLDLQFRHAKRPIDALKKAPGPSGALAVPASPRPVRQHPLPGRENHIIEPLAPPGARQFDNVGRTRFEEMGTRSGGLSVEVGDDSATTGSFAKQTAEVGVMAATTGAETQAKPAGLQEGRGDSGEAAVLPGAADLTALPNPAPVHAVLISQAQAFDIVVQARTLSTQDKARRKKRRDTNPSKETQKDYKGKCALLDQALDGLQGSGGPVLSQQQALLLVFSRYAAKKSSFYKMYSAYRWRALDRLNELLILQNTMQAVGDRSKRWLDCVAELKAAMVGFEAIDAVSHEDCLSLSRDKVVRSQSKKEVLRRLKPGWFEAFLALSEQSKTYRSPALLMCLCGFRPEELNGDRHLKHGLTPGITASLTECHVIVKIPGAKVRKTAGQPERSFALRRDALPDWFIEELMAAGGSKIYTKKPANIARHFTRVSEQLYPRQHLQKPRDILISPYVFRHFLATNLRDAEWETEEIAIVLGESVGDTVRHYGLGRRTASKSPRASEVVRGTASSARKVRPVDRSGIRAVRKLGAAPKV